MCAHLRLFSAGLQGDFSPLDFPAARLTLLRMNRRPPSELQGSRLDEVAEILAAGLMRLRRPKSSELSAAFGESSLNISARQSGPASPEPDAKEPE